VNPPVTLAAAATRFTLPDELSAARPPEARGLARDQVRLLVADTTRVRHARFRDLPGFLAPGDLLVVNTSGTLPAAVPGATSAGPVVVHFSAALAGPGAWEVELRTAPDGATPVLDATAGTRVRFADGSHLTLVSPAASPHPAVPPPPAVPPHPVSGGAGGGPELPPGAVRLWRAQVHTRHGDVPALLDRLGRAIRYSYVDGEWPLSAYQTVFATRPGSAEMPSAGRAFTPELVTALVSTGVLMAPLLLHTGVSSTEAGEPPQAEWYRVPPVTAGLVGHVRRAGGRVVAVGTTVVRALESATGPDGRVRAGSGRTTLVLGPGRPARVVDGLVTGLHAPHASHLLLLEAVAGPELVQRAYDAAVARRYLWHEFGDLSLLLPHHR
jgi:S-adenosylmethionine:tRNA ribosyltransferase-isomerase